MIRKLITNDRCIIKMGMLVGLYIEGMYVSSVGLPSHS